MLKDTIVSEELNALKSYVSNQDEQVFESTVAEAHHIDYFVNILNNNADNQLIVCPNHHRIIHDLNPVFNKKKLLYLYPNGREEGLFLNKHL